MRGRKNGREKRRMKKGMRIAMYSAFTVLLTCLAVTGYYLISNGVIFGKFTVKPDTYKMGEVTEVDENKIRVTSQDKKGVMPLTSDNEDLPVIPSTNGKEMTKENPFVVLEIVPELSQQSLGYLVDSEEKGLPFNPVELGIKFCNEAGSGYLDSSHQNIISQGDIANRLMNKGGYFQNELWDRIKNAKGEVVNYYEVKFLYEFGMYSSDIDISEEDFKNKTVHQLYEENKAAFALAYPDKFTTETDAEGNITSVSCTDRSFGFALNETDTNGNYTDRNWVKTIEENKDITRSYKFTIPAGKELTDADLSLTMEQLAAKYPALFETDDNGSKVPADILAKDKKWVKNREQRTTEFTKGYFVKAGKGKGEYTLEVKDAYTPNKIIKATKTGTDTDMWNYVDSDVYPDGNGEIFEQYAGMLWNINNILKDTNDSDIGKYIKLWYEPNYEQPWNTKGTRGEKAEDVFTFDYAKYVYSFKYAGIKINELLKYALFKRDEQKEYDEMYLQVITVTPEMINEMDANDDANTLDYIERADLFYINQMYDGYNTSADGKELDIAINFYNKYCTESGKTIDVNNKSNIKTFYDTDLEWFDCLKIIKRLGTDKQLPMMMTKLVGSMGNNGVDGTINSKVYVDADHRAVEVAGMLNNISKLQLILAQFDLVDLADPEDIEDPDETWELEDHEKSEETEAIEESEGTPAPQTSQAPQSSQAPQNTEEPQGYSKSFKDRVFKKLKVMELNSDQQDNSKFPAKYTGYFERPLAESSDSESYKKRCYYLWNKFTFLPTDLKNFFPKNIGGGDFAMDEIEHKLKPQGTLGTLVKDYEFLDSFFWNYINPGAYDTLYQNPNDIGSSQALPRIDGSDGNDEKNVTFVSNTQSTNINMGVLSEVTANRMLEILHKILNNANSDLLDGNKPKRLTVKLKPNKKEYVRVAGDQALLDYNNEAEYRDASKKITLKISCANNNDEDAVIRNLTFVKPEQVGEEADNILNFKKPLNFFQVYNEGTEQFKSIEKKFEKVEKIIDKNTGKVKYKGGIKRSDGKEPLEGYRIEKDKKTSYEVPFKLSVWQEGYTVLRVDWTVRCIKVKHKKGNNEFYISYGSSYIYIGERGLSNLE